VRRRLDAELVRRGLAADPTAARLLVADGRVLVGGAPALKDTRMVAAGESVVVEPVAARFVGRGGEKLDGALERFEIHVGGLDVLDAGASTGGFTDCLLQRGARHVCALDVGHNQLHERLRSDPRVTVMERTNLRHVDPTELGPFDGAVGDLSFISLGAVIDQLVGLVRPGAPIVLLVKPQFEASHEVVSRGRGIVADPDVWRDSLVSVLDAADRAGAAMMGVMASPLRGTGGNVEFLVHLRRTSADAPNGVEAGLVGAARLEAVRAALAEAVADGVGR